MTPDPATGSIACYLKQVSELNPMWRAADLIDLRSRTLKIPRCDQAVAIGTTADLTQLRTAFKQFLDRIQSQFWQLPQPLLLQQLATIDTQKLPELAAVVQRLRTVAECRGQFPRLAQEPWMVASLFHSLKTAVVLPQSDAGIIRERFTRSISSRKELRTLHKAINQIQLEYPQLYQLERDFLQTLLKLELPRGPQAATGEASSGSSESNYGWLIIIGVFIVIRVIMSYLRMGVISP